MFLQTLKTIAATAYAQTDYAISLYAVLEASNRERIAELSNTDAGYAFVRIRESVLGNLVMVLARLHDPVGDDRASIPRFFALLNRLPTTEALIETDGPRLIAEGHNTLDLVRSVQVEWREFSRTNRRRLKTLRDFRNALLAHNLTASVTDLPTYGDIFDLLTASRPIVERISWLTGVNLNSLEHVPDIWLRRANALWDRVFD